MPAAVIRISPLGIWLTGRMRILFGTKYGDGHIRGTLDSTAKAAVTGGQMNMGSVTGPYTR